MAGDVTTFVRAGGSTGTSVTIDIGAQGSGRLVVVSLNDESNPGQTFQGSVSIGGVTFTQGVVAQNTDGAGSHTEMHYATESDLGATAGSQTLVFSGGDTGWAIHAMVFAAAPDEAPTDTGIDNSSIAPTNISVTVDVPAGGVAVFAAANGGTGNVAADITSPMVEVTNNSDGAPASANLSTAYALEASAQTGKTYVADPSSATLRNSGAILVWGPAVTEGIDDVDSGYGAASDEFDTDELTLDINGSGFEATQNDGAVWLADAATLASSTAEVDITAGVYAWSDTLARLDLGMLTTELASIETLIVSDGHALHLIVVNDTGDEYTIPVAVHRAQAFTMAASANIAASATTATTARLTPPAGKDGGDFEAGLATDDINPITTTGPSADSWKELLHSIAATSDAVDGETYQFRLLYDGEAVTSTVTPTLTISATSGTEAPAEQATGTGTADDATATVATTAEQSTGAGTASDSSTSVTATAGQAAGDGTADDGSASITVTGQPADGVGTADDATAGVATEAEQATGTGTALDATVATVAVTNAPAEQANGTGAASDGTAAVSAQAGQAGGTGTAGDATVTTEEIAEAPAEQAQGTGTGGDGSAAVAISGGQAAAVGSALDATVATVSSTEAPAEQAAGVAGASDGSVMAAVAAAFAPGSGVANSATVLCLVLAAIATATGTAFDAMPMVGVHAGQATGTGTALDATTDGAQPPVRFDVVSVETSVTVVEVASTFRILGVSAASGSFII